jgi:hypothetical protein
MEITAIIAVKGHPNNIIIVISYSSFLKLTLMSTVSTNVPNPTVFSAKDPNSEAWEVQLINHGSAESVIIQAFAECAMLVDAP